MTSTRTCHHERRTKLPNVKSNGLVVNRGKMERGHRTKNTEENFSTRPKSVVNLGKKNAWSGKGIVLSEKNRHTNRKSKNFRDDGNTYGYRKYCWQPKVINRI